MGRPGPQALAQAISRQGVRTVNVESVRVVDESFVDVPRDGESMGEIVIRSNTVVPRYHGDHERSSEVIRDGWLFTGDLAVMHPDGYLEVRDRSKDIIISGGENVSSIEVENILLSHPAVSEAAVVASPHPTWGEVPVAYVTLRPEQEVSEADLIEYVRGPPGPLQGTQGRRVHASPQDLDGQGSEVRTTEEGEGPHISRHEQGLLDAVRPSRGLWPESIAARDHNHRLNRSILPPTRQGALDDR